MKIMELFRRRDKEDQGDDFVEGESLQDGPETKEEDHADSKEG